MAKMSENKTNQKWEKGGPSPNPGGRPKEVAEVKELARVHTAAAIETLVRLLNGPDPKASVAAARELLDRGYGRPSQALEVTGEDGKPLFARLPEPELVAFVKAGLLTYGGGT
jgi:hypothetical protein